MKRNKNLYQSQGAFSRQPFAQLKNRVRLLLLDVLGESLCEPGTQKRLGSADCFFLLLFFNSSGTGGLMRDSAKAVIICSVAGIVPLKNNYFYGKSKCLPPA